MRNFIVSILAVVALFSGNCMSAQENVQERYMKKEVMVPMRDGKKLYTAIYAPKDSVLISPILVVRTPYSLAPYFKSGEIKLQEFYHTYLEKNYVLVFQNVRGTMMSEGDFEHIREINAHPGQSDDATDTYDTVEWLLENTSNNGNVGFMGVSYAGFYATVAALCGHPAIKAVSPQAPIADWFLGDDAHINGAFLNSIYGFGSRQFRHRPHPTDQSPKPVVKIEGDYYDYFLDKGSIANVFKDFGDSLAFFNEIQKHPNYDGFWQRRSPLFKMKEVQPAMMVVGGWYDREDLYGTLATYTSLKRLSPKTDAYLVMGPWAHGSWNKLSYNHLGDTWFGEGSSRYLNEKILPRFFDRYLRNRYELQIPAVQYLPSGETEKSKMAGVSSDSLWQTASAWPLKETEKEVFYLTGDNELSEKITQRKGFHSYLSSPERPVRCVGKEMTNWASDQVTGDQGYMTWRSDVLTYTGEELKDTLKVVGNVVANLSMSINTTDADMVVKLIDVRPDGYQMLVRWSVLPLRFREGFIEPKPVTPNYIMKVRVPMEGIAHYFMPGHRLMIQVQSSMFPWVAMSPQQFMENPYLATKKDYKPAEVKVFTNKVNSSYVTLPVLR